MSYERCEDAPACGHIECGFGLGVPGYGSMVGGVPFYGSNKVPAPDYDKTRRLIDELADELRLMPVDPSRPNTNGATMFSRVFQAMQAYVANHESSRKSNT